MDLLTRGAGFGYIGSTITSLIYASFTFIFFALEAAIMAQALELYFNIPLVAGYIICSLIILPITFFGITAINKLQSYTQFVWLFLMILPFVMVFHKEPELITQWSSFVGDNENSHQFDIVLFGQACAVLFALVVQIGEQVDYLRFMPNKTKNNSAKWYLSVILAGPGWIIIGGLKLLGGSLLAVLFIQNGGDISKAVEPIQMYILGYQYVFDSNDVVLAVATFFVIVSQIKINATNAYAGSLAWSNFFSRVTHYHPGRVVWLVFNILIALLLMLLGIFETLESVLSVYANLAIAWIGAIVADLSVLKPLKISPSFIEFKRAHLYDYNPVGCLSMLLASLLSVVCFTGFFGEIAQAYSPFIALGTSFTLAIIIGFITKGKYYLAREPLLIETTSQQSLVFCSVCDIEYEIEDIAYCPFHQGNICSLCCSLENHCHDQCKIQSVTSPSRETEVMHSILLQKVDVNIGRRLSRFFAVFSAMSIVTGAFFLLAFHFSSKIGSIESDALLNIIINIYLVVLVLIAISAWVIVLTQESRERAERELLQSLNYLEITKNELVQSEKLSSLGKLVAGIAHEVNTPLGICVTCGSLFSDSMKAFQQKVIKGELTKSDLDSFITESNEVKNLLNANLEKSANLIQNFKQVAVDQASSVRRQFDIKTTLEKVISTLTPLLDKNAHKLKFVCPKSIFIDSYPGPIGQVLTNLINNSILHGFEQQINGEMTLSVAINKDQKQITIIFEDNGKGIPIEHLDRIFDPFFTTKMGEGGSGLGLNIAFNIVNNILGGNITVTSELGKGTAFILSLPTVSPKK